MKIHPFVFIFLLGALAFAQTPDNRGYDQIAAVPNKTVVDYFLLCPDIVLKTYDPGTPAELALARVDDKLDTKGADLDFRKSLLAKGAPARGLVVSSALVDQKNAYIKIEGTHQGRWKFSLVFVYFERADKTRIPALSYHYTGMEEIEDYHLFFDISDGSWKAIPDERLFPPISEKPLLPYVGEGDTSTTAWILEDLPRYGTTVRFLPRRQSLEGQGDPKLATADDYLQKLAPYALECAWDKTQARFAEPKPALADKSDVPQGKATAADIFAILPISGDADSLSLDLKTRRAARDAWKSSAHDTKSGATAFFSWTEDPDEGKGGVTIKLLGQFKGFPLFAAVDWEEEIYNLRTLIYHADTGLLEPVSLFRPSVKDFYKGSRAKEASKMWPQNDPSCLFDMEEGSDSIGAQLDAYHDESVREYPPDVTLSLRWDDASASFLQSEQKFTM
jgi:hypothetical protein